MPIFRYECRSCGKNFELLLPRFDSEAACPDCGSHDLIKALNRFAAVTKTGPASCASRHDCPAAGSPGCGCGCGCGHHHHH